MMEINAKEKIRDATYALIAQEGIQSVTVRKIASRAGVNLAAINYHFGSKDKVINAVLEHLVDRLKDAFAHLEDVAMPANIRLQNFLITHQANIFQYPDLIRNFIYQSFKKTDEPNAYQTFLSTKGTPLLQKTLMEATCCNEEDAKMKAMLLIGGMVLPAILDKQTEAIFKINMDDPAQQSRYARIILNSVVTIKNV